jgi:hypothetical protein
VSISGEFEGFSNLIRLVTHDAAAEDELIAHHLQLHAERSYRHQRH